MNQFSVKGYAGGGAARVARRARAAAEAGEEMDASEEVAVAVLQKEEQAKAARAAKQALALAAKEGVPIRSTIRGAQRRAFPGVYFPPAFSARMAETRVAPESPNLEQVFGVRRRDLAQMAEKPGSALAVIPNAPARAQGSRKTEQVMFPANTARLVDLLQAGREYAPQLTEGMTGWYMMDPVYQRMVELVGPEEAAKRYRQFNALTAMASPSSDVETELMRGTAANRLANMGRFNEFEEHGGKSLLKRREEGLPEYLTSFPSHAYHKTAQAPAMRKFLESGDFSFMKSPKVPLYLQASMADPLGRQSDVLVGDAHWARGVGLADVRNMLRVKGKPTLPGASVSTPELAALAPWWREKVARESGYEAVPAQANIWGLLSPQTGVETAIGAPKLEILSDLIARTARSRNIPLNEARDLVLMGELHAGMAKGGKVKADDDNVAYDQVAPDLKEIAQHILKPIYAGAASNLKSANRRLPQSIAMMTPGLRELAMMTGFSNAGDMPAYGLSSGLASLPAMALMVDPELAQTKFMQKAIEAGDAVAALGDRELSALGLPERDRLSPIQEVMMTGGEMLSQVPVPGGMFRSLAVRSPKTLKAIDLSTEYFLPTVEPKASNYLAGTGVGSAFNFALRPSEEELDE